MLGSMSARYESNGDAGAIGRNAGDAGGASYGAYQFAANVGVPEDFVEWLGEEGYEGASVLRRAGEPGTAEFDEAWQQVAAADPTGFYSMQHRYVEVMYYQPAKAALLDAGVDIGSRSAALRQVAWSAAVQYGSGYVAELFQSAAGLVDATPAELDDGTLIECIYAVRASDEWTAGSPGLRPGLRARFAEECREALGMLE
jgi:hypothetical protein